MKKIKEHIPVIYAEAKINEKYIIKFKIKTRISKTIFVN